MPGPSAAVLLIYLVLVAQFGSFRDPLVVLLGSVPLALRRRWCSPFLGFTTINIYSQIGLICRKRSPARGAKGAGFFFFFNERPG